MDKLTLYHYWRSSSSWRVRWALALKKLKPEYVAVNLLDGSNESPEHLARNPLGYVPVLNIEGRNLVESFAIIEFLEERVAQPRLFPVDAFDRQHVRALCEIINSGTQPLQNPNVTEMVSDDQARRQQWNQHWIRRGLHAFQTLAAPRAGRFAFGDQVTAADIFLGPQCYAAARFEVSVEKEFPQIARWLAEAAKTPEYLATHPDRFKPA